MDDSDQDIDAALSTLDNLSDADREALDALSQLSPDEVRGLNITPEAERFPPIAPPVPPPPRDTRQTLKQRAQKVDPKDEARRARARSFNQLTMFMLLLTVTLGVIYAIIWQNPFSILNPFPPEVVYIEVTATFPPPSAVIVATETPAPDSVPSSEFAFRLAEDEVIYTANANDRGCDWASIGGLVTATDGTAMNGYRVQITGDELDETIFTGTAPAFGDGGYEVTLGDTPIAERYIVQLLDRQGDAVAPPVEVFTRETCDANVAIVNFVEN